MLVNYTELDKKSTTFCFVLFFHFVTLGLFLIYKNAPTFLIMLYYYQTLDLFSFNWHRFCMVNFLTRNTKLRKGKIKLITHRLNYLHQITASINSRCYNVYSCTT